jgi:hypothetical protein
VRRTSEQVAPMWVTTVRGIPCRRRRPSVRTASCYCEMRLQTSPSTAARMMPLWRGRLRGHPSASSSPARATCTSLPVHGAARRWFCSGVGRPVGGAGAAVHSPPLPAAAETGDRWRAVLVRVGVLVQFGSLLYIVNNYGVSSTLCQGPSMVPTLNPAGDVVMVEHISASLGILRRGDVVVAKSVTDPSAIVCKRILGVAGDIIPAKLRYAPYPRVTDEDTVVPRT